MKTKAQNKRLRTVKLLKTSILFLIVALICAIAFGTAYLFGFDITSRLDPKLIYNVEQSTLVYDKNGAEIATVHGLENRIWVPLSSIPDYVQKAFVAAEDVRFYTHSGIDVKRIFGALLNDIKAGQLVEGASTITQQLIKNSMLSRKKVFSRKIEEALLALELERRYSKDEILEMYLNYVYFGANAYGIEAAAQTYFCKSASSLTLEEGALLAGILKSTARYAPHTNPDASLQRRNTVLSLMAQYGFISEEQAVQAKATELRLAMPPANDTYGYYLDAALTSAADLLNITYEELVRGGYRVFTAMDTKLQSILEQAFTNDALFPANAADGTKVQAAFVCIDPKTGLVTAVMGGRTYEVQRGLNRATQSRRQPGSAIKPLLVYAPAIQNRVYSPASIVIDEPKTFGQYTPKNSNGKYHGAVTMRQALVESLNIPAVEILSNTGIPDAKAFASALGIKFSMNDTGLSLALGGFETGITPIELCSGYSALASLGLYREPSFVTKITDSGGNILYENKVEATRVMSEDTAFIVSDMLADVVKSGTGKSLYLKDIPLSGKTGTNGYVGNSNRDIWMAAYNTDLTAVVWMGFDKTDNEHNLSSAATGGNFPAKLLKSIIGSYYENEKAPQYTVPIGIQKVRLDKSALLNGDLKLAASYLMDKDVVEEFLFDDQAAMVQQDASSLQCIVYNFTVGIDDSGFPVLSFSSTSNIARFEILRKSEGEAEQVIDTITGEDRLLFTDNTAQAGKGYTYAIQPVDESGQKLGERSTQLYIYVQKPLP